MLICQTQRLLQNMKPFSLCLSVAKEIVYPYDQIPMLVREDLVHPSLELSCGIQCTLNRSSGGKHGSVCHKGKHFLTFLCQWHDPEPFECIQRKPIPRIG